MVHEMHGAQETGLARASVRDSRAERTMMRPTLTISARTCPALLLAALATGCGVSQEAYDKAIDGAHRARIEASQRGAEVTALRAQVYRLAADLQDRDVRLSDATTAQAGMIRKLDELALLNAELSERLRKAGQSVAELAGERGSLSAALAETRARLEELARQQAAAEARAAQFRDLAARFQRMIDPRASLVQRHRQSHQSARSMPVPAGEAWRNAQSHHQAARPAHPEVAGPSLRLYALWSVCLRSVR